MSKLRERWQIYSHRSFEEWKWVLRRRLRPNHPYVVSFSEEMKIQICLHDTLGLSYALQREFEPDISEFLKRVLRSGMVFFDVGANIGHFTLLAAKLVTDKGKVHAFEPSTTEFSKLLSNLRLNRLSNVVANQMAVANTDGDIFLNICNDGCGVFNSMGVPIPKACEGIMGGVQIEMDTLNVPCTTLDSYVAARAISQVDIVKIDIEGAELEAVKGARQLLLRERSPIVICEFCDLTTSTLGYSTKKLRSAFEEMGFSLYRYDLQTRKLFSEPRQDRYDYANLICLKDRHKNNLAPELLFQ